MNGAVQPAPRIGTRALAAALFAASVALYLPTLGHGFAFDDDIVIVKNRFIRSVGALPQLLTRTEWAGGGIEVAAWRPLTDLTYAANHLVGGLTPWGYHLVNALLSGLVALLLFQLGRRLGLAERSAALAALLFAVHPLHVEVVANVTGRKELLAAGFLLAMLLLHRRAVERGGATLLLPVAAYVAAMLSKEVGVVGLGLAVAVDLLATDGALRSPGPARERALRLHALYFAALVAYVVLLRLVTGKTGFGEIPFQDNPAAHASTWVRLLTALAVIGKGLRLHLLPVGQSPDWSFDALPLATSVGDPRVLATLAALGLWLAVGLRQRRANPLVLLSLVWYAAALSPASNVLFPVGTLFGERLLYLPGVGLALLAGLALQRLAERSVPASRWATVAAAVAALALAAATLRYSAAWGDERRLFEWAARSAPRSAKVHWKLASLHSTAGQLDGALGEVQTALGILPNDASILTTEAEILGKLGRSAEQERALRRAVAADAGNPDAAYALSRIDRDAGRIEEAAALWRRVLQIRPEHAGALGDLATWHLLRGELGSARELAERAAAVDPTSAAAWYNLGLIYRSLRDPDRSRAAFRRFLETAGAEYAAEAASVRAALERGEL